jgi:hypothetical protein
MRATVPVLCLAVLGSTTACQVGWSERVTGVGVGGAAGGLLASAVGAGTGGIVLGVAAGAAAGYIIGDWIADQRERGDYVASADGKPCGTPCAAAGGGAPRSRVMGASGSLPEPGPDRAGARREYEAGRRAATAAAAIAHYEEASRLDPSAPEPHNARGLVLLYGGDGAGARDAFVRSLAADAAYAPAARNLARLDAAK